MVSHLTIKGRAGSLHLCYYSADGSEPEPPLVIGTRKYAGNKCIDPSLLPLYEETRPGQMVVGLVEQTPLWHRAAAITPSSATAL